MRRLAVCVVLLCAGCSGSSPAAPTPPPLPACQSQNTFELTVRNQSPENYTFDLLIDNVTRGTMGPGQSVGPLTLTAGVNHAIVSRVTNSQIIGCTSTASYPQCSTQMLICTF
jgi:hypothetical protein